MLYGIINLQGNNLIFRNNHRFPPTSILNNTW